MKTSIFTGILAKTAIITVFATPSFAQIFEINKVLDWKSTLDIQKEVENKRLISEKEASSTEESSKVADSEVKPESGKIKNGEAEKILKKDNYKDKERVEALENYICQKESQLKELEEKFSTFQDSILQSTTEMQNLIKQLAFMNQSQIQRAPSVYDHFDNLYPMMMIQQMQHQMFIQNLNYNHNQSMNNLLMTSAMSYYANPYGQNTDAYTYGQENLQNQNILSYNLDRLTNTNSYETDTIQGSLLHWNNSTPSTNFDSSGLNIKATADSLPVEATADSLPIEALVDGLSS